MLLGYEHIATSPLSRLGIEFVKRYADKATACRGLDSVPSELGSQDVHAMFRKI